MIYGFFDKHRWLSNFATLTTPITDEFGIEYPTVEHFYQASKTVIRRQREVIALSKTAGVAKRNGQLITLRDDWEKIKCLVMENGVRLKYNQEPFKQQLLETGEEEILEANYWGDLFWGVDYATGTGKNVLGVLIMKIREEIRNDSNPQKDNL